MDRKEVLAKNLAHLMKLKGVTRADMSSDLDIKYTTLNDWVHGLKFPRYDKLEKLADYFGVTINDLVSETDSVQNYRSLLKADWSEEVPDNKLISIWRQLTPEGQNALRAHAELLLLMYKKEK